MRLKDKIAQIYGTPAVVIDLDIVDKNIARIQGLMDRAGVANRPHIKTHKSPELAKLQRDAGAKGITCQKLGEAEIFADAGFDDILITYNILGAEKEARIAGLLQRSPVELTIAADNPFTLDGLSRAGVAAGRAVGVVIECDTGRKRAGVETAREAIALAKDAASRRGINFRGLMLYPPTDGWAESQRFVDETLVGLHEAGLTADIISTGGSPNIPNAGKLKGATEHRPGTYIFNDRMQVQAGVASLHDCALKVYATVVSRGGPERGILDAGSKTLTSDTGGLEGFGYILEHPDAKIWSFAEEHGFLDLSTCNNRPNVGDVVRIIPNHVCVVVNMTDRVIAVRGEEIIGEMKVTARGKNT